MSRRLLYLYHILSRNEHELISKVYNAQVRKPVKGDWSNQIKIDKESLNVEYSDQEIKDMSKRYFKEIVKTKIRKLAFHDLENRKKDHSKVKDINYTKLEMQAYMKDKKNYIKDIELLFSLRTRGLDVKTNFRGKYKNSLQCDLNFENFQCDSEESQIHLLQCEVILRVCPQLYDNCDTEYEDIFGNPVQQLRIVRLYREVLEARQRLIDERDANNSDDL